MSCLTLWYWYVMFVCIDKSLHNSVAVVIGSPSLLQLGHTLVQP